MHKSPTSSTPGGERSSFKQPAPQVMLPVNPLTQKYPHLPCKASGNELRRTPVWISLPKWPPTALYTATTDVMAMQFNSSGLIVASRIRLPSSLTSEPQDPVLDFTSSHICLSLWASRIYFPTSSNLQHTRTDPEWQCASPPDPNHIFSCVDCSHNDWSYITLK